MGPDPAGLTQIESLFSNLITAAVSLGFIALLVMLVVAGIRYLTSGGEPKSLQAAGQTLTWALLGLLFMLFAWLILLLISQFTDIPTLKLFDVKVLCIPTITGCE